MNAWYIGVVAWVCVIFFSSTALASQWCEELFRWLSGLLFASLPPTDSSYGLLHFTADKGLHLTLFAVLALLLWKAYDAKRRKVWLILATGLFVGSCSEFLQRFFPGRDPAVRDVLINLAGTAIGVCLVTLARKWRDADRPDVTEKLA